MIRISSQTSPATPAVAYVTFLEGNTDYLKGVLALARSLRLHACAHRLVVGAAPTVSEENIRRLGLEPNVEVRRIEWLALPETLAGANLECFANPQFIRNFTKLRLWEFDDFSKLVYLDADTLAFANLDDMFLAPAFSAVLDNMSADEAFDPARFQTPSVTVRSSVEQPDKAYFNAGVFVFEPSRDELNTMYQLLATWQPTRFAEQDFLNAFFKGRWNMLPITYNWGKPNFWLCPELLCGSMAALKVVHFSGAFKPWHGRDTTAQETIFKAPPPEKKALETSSLLQAAVAKWWEAFDHAVTESAPPVSQPEQLMEQTEEGNIGKRLLLVTDQYVASATEPANHAHWLATAAMQHSLNVTVLSATHRGTPGKETLVTDTSIVATDFFELIIVLGSGRQPQDAVLEMLADGLAASPVLFVLNGAPTTPTALRGMQHAQLLGWTSSFDLAHIQRHGQGAKAVNFCLGTRTDALGRPGLRSKLGLRPKSRKSKDRLFMAVCSGPAEGDVTVRFAQRFATLRGNRDFLHVYAYPMLPGDSQDDWADRCSQLAGVTIHEDAHHIDVLDAMCEADACAITADSAIAQSLLAELMLNRCRWLAHKDCVAAADLCEREKRCFETIDALAYAMLTNEKADDLESALDSDYQMALRDLTVLTTVQQLEQMTSSKAYAARAQRFRVSMDAGSVTTLDSLPPKLSLIDKFDEGARSVIGKAIAPTVTAALTSESDLFSEPRSESISTFASRLSLDCRSMSPALQLCARDARSPPFEADEAAYVTLLAGKGDYYKGVLALHSSLRRAGSQLPLIVAVTADVPAEHRQTLTDAGCLLRPVHQLMMPQMLSSSHRYARKEFAICYTKLQLWSWTDYRMLIYLDADALATRNLDSLATALDVHEGHLELAAARDCGVAPTVFKPKGDAPSFYFNAGVMVLRPSESTYRALLYRLHQPDQPVTAYAEQDFLNAFFAGRVLELPMQYNCLVEYFETDWFDAKKLGKLLEAEGDEPLSVAEGSAAQEEQLPAVLHFTVPKPWRQSSEEFKTSQVKSLSVLASMEWQNCFNCAAAA